MEIIKTERSFMRVVRREDMRSMETGYGRLITIERAPRFSGRETKRRRRRKISEPEIPNDVMEEIMLRLPVPSVMRFQIVSKHWKALIRSREFGERYMAYQKGKVPKLFCVGIGFNDRGESDLMVDRMALESASASLEDSRNLRVKNFKGYVQVSESCDGIVCIYGLTKAVRLVNAAMSTIFEELRLAKIQRVYMDNPDPRLATSTRFGFGKDSVTGRYKLVWLYNKYPITSTSLTCKKKTRCEVLDLEDKIWRFVSTRPLDHHHILNNQRPAFANGSFYWLTGYQVAQTKLIVFDIHTEMFQLTPTPPFITPHGSPKDIGLCNLNGRLCVSELNGDCTQDFWWRVQDKDGTWEKIFSVNLRSTSTWFRHITSKPLTPLAILRDENKVILSLTYEKNLVAFDLNTSLYHLYYAGVYGSAVPYFPSISISLASF